MKVRLIDEKCQGHGRCYSLAPEVFESDDIGNACVIGDGSVPAGEEGNAQLAVDNCPEFAIEVVEP